jgi:hypothetical protein
MAEQPPVPGVNVTAAVTPGFVTGTGISSLYSPDMLSLDQAVSFLRQDFAGESYTLVSVNLTDRYSGQRLYEFTIQASDSSKEPGSTVFEDAVSGDPYTPGQENARITAPQAQDLARRAFLAIQPDHVRVRYSESPDAGMTWNFALVKDTDTVLRGTLDAETGLIVTFTRTILMEGRPSVPVLDMPAAQKSADRYISGQNGPVAISMITGQYLPLGFPSDPVAGRYVLTYSRIVNNIPCNADGFVVGVDSVTGEITMYERNWRAPDNAFSVATEPFVLRREATFAVLQRAKEMYPAVSGLRIVSAEITWMDRHSPGVTPRPGSIPLAWKVVFDDGFIQMNRPAQPATGWVDAQSGKILDFQYRH